MAHGGTGTGSRNFEQSKVTINTAYIGADSSTINNQQTPSTSQTRPSTTVAEHDVIKLDGSIRFFKNEKIHKTKPIYNGEMTNLGGSIPLVVKFTYYNKETLREAKSLHSTDFHCNVVRIYNSGTCKADFEEFIYMAMERCSTETLFDYLNQHGHNFNPHQAIQHSAQIISGLEYIHSKGIAHRDLKPDNILFSATDGYNQIKIADFGMSKNYFAEPNPTTGWRPGTMGFIAPELIKRTKPSDITKCDIFSLGILLTYRLSNGKHPYGKEDYLWISNIATGAEPDLSIIALPNTNQNNAAARVIKKMLQYDPSNRPAAQYLMNDWHKEVGDFLEESETPIMSSNQANHGETRKCMKLTKKPGVAKRLLLWVTPTRLKTLVMRKPGKSARSLQHC